MTTPKVKPIVRRAGLIWMISNMNHFHHSIDTDEAEQEVPGVRQKLYDIFTTSVHIASTIPNQRMERSCINLYYQYEIKA